MNAIEQATDGIWGLVPWVIGGGVAVLLFTWLFKRFLARIKKRRK